jgi:hypothetical protein
MRWPGRLSVAWAAEPRSAAADSARLDFGSVGSAPVEGRLRRILRSSAG